MKPFGLQGYNVLEEQASVSNSRKLYALQIAICKSHIF